MSSNSCILINNNNVNKRLEFGRGKKFSYKHIGDKVLVYKKGVEVLLDSSEFLLLFKVVNNRRSS